MSSPLIGVPVKAFGVAKQRLAPRLGPASRSRLGKALARRTVETLLEAGARTSVVVEDDVVEAWATALGFDTIRSPQPGLNSAAASVVAAADGRPWGVVFADLPLLQQSDVRALLEAGKGGGAIAPARDGGTNALVGSSPIEFAYGPGSFARHLHRLRHQSKAAVVVRSGLALDLDNPADLDHAARLSPWMAGWLEQLDS